MGHGEEATAYDAVTREKTEQAEARLDKIDELLLRTLNRVPPWVAWVFAGGGAIIGWLLSECVQLVKGG